MSRKGSGFEDINSLADPRLKKLKIGVNLFVSTDGEHSPPEMALSRYGVIGNLRGYSTSYDETSGLRTSSTAWPTRTWTWQSSGGQWPATSSRSPRYRWCSPRSRPRRTRRPAFPCSTTSGWRSAARIRRLRDSLQTLLDRRASDIQAILKGYGVPVIPPKKRRQRIQDARLDPESDRVSRPLAPARKDRPSSMATPHLVRLARALRGPATC